MNHILLLCKKNCQIYQFWFTKHTRTNMGSDRREKNLYPNTLISCVKFLVPGDEQIDISGRWISVYSTNVKYVVWSYVFLTTSDVVWEIWSQINLDPINTCI